MIAGCMSADRRPIAWIFASRLPLEVYVHTTSRFLLRHGMCYSCSLPAQQRKDVTKCGAAMTPGFDGPFGKRDGMKVAVPEWQGRVSPVFDVASHLVVVELDHTIGECDRRTESLGNAAAHERAGRLRDLGVDVLVCGAISWPLEAMLISGGVRVIPLVCGPVDEVVQAFRDGTLEDGRFAMPGCCRKRQRNQARRRCRAGGL